MVTKRFALTRQPAQDIHCQPLDGFILTLHKDVPEQRDTFAVDEGESDLRQRLAHAVESDALEQHAGAGQIQCIPGCLQNQLAKLFLAIGPSR